MEQTIAGRKLAAAILKNYADAVHKSDDLIAQYEALENLKQPSSSQIARMKELEQEIPEAVAKDKALKEKVVELLKLPGPDLPPRTLQVFVLRYLNSMEWKEVTATVYGQRDDFKKDPRRYQNIVFKIHGRGLDIIGAALDKAKMK